MIKHICRVALGLMVPAALVAAGCGGTGTPSSEDGAKAGKQGPYTIGMVPKTTGDPFFVATRKGAEQAANELGVKLVYSGPPTYDVAGQVQVVGQLAQRHVNAITVSANDPNALVPVMEKAAASGIETSTWNADIGKAGRQFFLNNPTADELGKALVEQVVEATGPKAKVLVITSTLTAPNQNSWLEAMKKYIAAKYPDFVFQKVLPGQAEAATSYNVAKTWLQAHRETQAIISLDAFGVAGSAKAAEALGRKGKVVLTGIGVPSQNGKDIKSGTVKSAVLWNPVDLGYATIYMVKAQLDGKIKPGMKSLDAGRLGQLKFGAPDTILLGKPLVFTKDNVDDYDF